MREDDIFKRNFTLEGSANHPSGLSKRENYLRKQIGNEPRRLQDFTVQWTDAAGNSKPVQIPPFVRYVNPEQTPNLYEQYLLGTQEERAEQNNQENNRPINLQPEQTTGSTSAIREISLQDLQRNRNNPSPSGSSSSGSSDTTMGGNAPNNSQLLTLMEALTQAFNNV